MGDLDNGIAELERRVGKLEELTGRLLESAVRMQTITEMQNQSAAKWWALIVGMATSVVGSIAALVVTVAH